MWLAALVIFVSGFAAGYIISSRIHRDTPFGPFSDFQYVEHTAHGWIINRRKGK